MRTKFLTCALLSLSVAAATQDPNTLFEKAQQAQAKRDYGKAIALLKKADAAWDNSLPNAPEHVAALDLIIVLIKAQAADDSNRRGEKDFGVPLAAWRRDAAPFARRAVEICDASQHVQPEYEALALELEADVLGRDAEGAPFWARATKIRAERVAHLASFPPPEQLPPDQETQPSPTPSPAITQRPRLIAKREPEYTETARLMRYSGSALFSIIIDQHGVPKHIRLVRGLGYGLDEQAAKAVGSWRFRPALNHDIPVAVQANIEVNFRLL